MRVTKQLTRWEIYAPDGIAAFRDDKTDTVYAVLYLAPRAALCPFHGDDLVCSECQEWRK